MLKTYFLFLPALFISHLFLLASEPCVQKIQSSHFLEGEIKRVIGFSREAYDYHPSIDLTVWDALQPYFLPTDHPVRSILDLIFKSDRVTLNREKFIAAGFDVNDPKASGNLIVGRHPLLPGYLIKAYLDTQIEWEWENFFRRVTGARSIEQCIQKYGFQNYFEVPKKWIYPLPLNPSPPSNGAYYRKNFILLVEDKYILNQAENAKAFRNRITPQILNALYLVLTEEGLIDSVFRGNIPFNHFGRMCFIDTEHHHHGPIPYYNLDRYLSPEMRIYWQSLYLK